MTKPFQNVFWKYARQELVPLKTLYHKIYICVPSDLSQLLLLKQFHHIFPQRAFQFPCTLIPTLQGNQSLSYWSSNTLKSSSGKIQDQFVVLYCKHSEVSLALAGYSFCLILIRPEALKTLLFGSTKTGSDYLSSTQYKI